jgi:2-haloacid dehalogenase
MKVERRAFLQLAAGGALGAGTSVTVGDTKPVSGLRAIAFDAFTIFDPRPVAARAEALFPVQGAALMNTWRTRQFEYQWLRALSGRYADFLQATEEALQFAAMQVNLDLSVEARQQLMLEWSTLQLWPDAAESLTALRRSGKRLVLLSNMTEAVLTQGLQRGRIDALFEAVLSTDRIRSYKPDPRSYQLAVDRLQLRRDEILFAPFAGWDVAGAKWFGYPTFWVNRLDAPAEPLGVAADASGRDLAALLRFAGPSNSPSIP